MAIYVFSGLFLLVGGLLIKSYLTTRQRIARSQGWLSVNGRLGEVQVQERLKGGQSKRHFVLRLAYEYEVAGKVYAGDQGRIRFSAGNFFQSAHAAWRRAEEVKSKSPFVVHYDPADPSESVLFIEDSSAAGKILIAAIVFIAMGAAILIGPHL